ncbi:hypothetical protein [Glaciibacter superstes]|uniref:hypothetical protein n=1 Tax=Glaciibacter superstes TaxID=501023 RepID=UPI0003B4D0B4|nr:hypothetical protein [Glaciibacter superstes]
MMETHLAARLRAAADTDPTLLRELRAAYGGRFDVLDALWWRENPLSPTPAGLDDPAAELRELQSAVYSRASADEPFVEFTDPETGETRHATPSERRLNEVRRQLADDAAELDAVLDRFSDWPTRMAPANEDATNPGFATSDAMPTFATPTNAAMTDVAGNAGRPGSEAEFSDRFSRIPFRRTLLLLATGAAAGVLITLGVQAVQGPPASTEAASDSQPLTEYDGTIQAEARDEDGTPGSSNVLAIFDQPAQFPGDTVPNLGSAYIPESIRSVFGATPSVDGFGVYVAQRGVSQYCIIVQNADLTGSTECAGASVIEKYGLRLDAVVLGRGSDATDGPLDTLLDLRVSWGQDGTFSGGTTRHVAP